RTLVGLDGAWMVVALDLHHHRQPTADIHRTGVLFAGLHQDAWAGGRKAPEKRAAVLVAAVFAPHRTEEAEFDVIRGAPQQLGDARVSLAAKRYLVEGALVELMGCGW